jgi:UDP-N-acetylglucosamine:LPS N-acetylglucosamine transferase
MKKVMIVLGSGGHTAQMLKLLKLLGSKYNYEYVLNDDDKVSARKINGKIYRVANPRVFEDNILIRSSKLTKGFFQAYKIMRKSNAVAIISAGPGLTFPLFLAAKLFRKKTIFIESWCRITTKSISGRLCYPLSDMFFVQWPEMKKLYPKAIYAGRLG